MIALLLFFGCFRYFEEESNCKIVLDVSDASNRNLITTLSRPNLLLSSMGVCTPTRKQKLSLTY